MASVLPVAIREHLLDGPGTPEHRSVAVAFVEFRGTDDLLRSEGPAATAEALDELISNVSHAAASHGVTFFESDIAVDGGKVMLVAGAPRTTGHDADRLMRTARRILDHRGRLPLRVGINVGHVFSGDFGPTFRRTYSVKGDAINLAARVMGRAAPGEALATVAALTQAASRFETSSVAPFTVKGKAGPVQAVVLGPVVGGLERRVGRDNRLVGRDAELARMLGSLEEARAGRGGVVQLLGEPGIGKSRLIEEVVDAAHGLPTRTVVCDEYDAATPYAAARTLLRGTLGITERTPAAVALRLVTRRVGEAAPNLLPWMPLLGDVLDLEVDETPATAELDEQFRPARLELVVLELLQALLPGPALLTVDDAHQMDIASAALFSRLAAATGSVPWLLLVGRRDHDTGWVPAEEQVSVTLRVRALTPEQSLALAVAASGGRALPRPTLAALADKADGNPLFLESLVGAAGSDGRLDHVPESIEQVVAAQIDRLSPSRRSVLRHAAVLGSNFSTEELAGLVPDLAVPLGTQVDRGLDGGLADFLVADETGTRLRFRHGLIREVAYAGLAFRARRRIHEEVGLALERAASPDVGLLSFHFLQAGRYAKAWQHARAAGEQATRLYANTEATELLGRAVDAARRLPRGAVPALEVGRVLESLGDCWFTIGLTDAAARSFRQALQHVHGDPLATARIVTKQATVDQRLRHHPQAMRRVSRQLRSIEGLSGSPAHAARSALQLRLAISRISQGRVEEAIRWGTIAVREAELSGDPEALAPAYATLHGIQLAAGGGSHRELGAQALQAYVALGELSGQAQCTNNLAVGALEDGRWTEAAALFLEATHLYRRLGDTDNEGVALCNYAEVLVDQGHWAEAVPLLDQALDTARSVADDELSALALLHLGRARSGSGEADAGVALLQRARAILVEIDQPDELELTDVALTEALLAGGDPRGALTLAEDLLDGEPDEAAVTRLRALRGLALLGLDRIEDAVVELSAVVEPEPDGIPGYAYALACLGLARAGVTDAAWEERGRSALDGLDVVAVAPLLPGLT